MRDRLNVSERRICRVLGQHRSTQRRPRGRADEEQLVAGMIELTRQYGRYGYRRIAALLVPRQNLLDTKWPELREALAHRVVLMLMLMLMLITVVHVLAERQGL